MSALENKIGKFTHNLGGRKRVNKYDPTFMSEADELQKARLSFLSTLLFAQAPTQNPTAISSPIGWFQSLPLEAQRSSCA